MEEEWIKRIRHSHQPVSVVNQFCFEGLREPFSSQHPLDWSVSGDEHILRELCNNTDNCVMGASRASTPQQEMVHYILRTDFSFSFIHWIQQM